MAVSAVIHDFWPLTLLSLFAGHFRLAVEIDAAGRGPENFNMSSGGVSACCC
jgi:hypothetical protein